MLARLAMSNATLRNRQATEAYLLPFQGQTLAEQLQLQRPMLHELLQPGSPLRGVACLSNMLLGCACISLQAGGAVHCMQSRVPDSVMGVSQVEAEVPAVAAEPAEAQITEHLKVSAMVI